MGNVITVNLNYGCCRTEQYITDQKLYQYDYGQILKLTGIELPAVYEVHFSNGERGTSTTGIGTADGVEIPDQYLLNAGKLYVWLYTHTGTNDGETELGFWIPIIPRAQPTHEEPTPVQQSEIERLIALAEEIIEHGGGGGSGDDGFSPIVTVTAITGGHRISIQDKTHTATFDVMDGTDGNDGDDGVSPTVTITEITNGHRVTITDKNHPSGMSFDVTNGAKGDKGDAFEYSDFTPAQLEALKGADGKSGKSPYINSTNNHWMAYDDSTQQWTDTNVTAQGTKGDKGDDYVLTQQDKEDIAALVDVDVSDALSGVRYDSLEWINGKRYNMNTGELETRSNSQTSGKFTLENGCYTVTDAVEGRIHYFDFLEWDEDGNFVGCRETTTNETSFTFCANPKHWYAFNINDSRNLPENLTFTRNANPESEAIKIALDGTGWTSSNGNVYVDITSQIEAVFSGMTVAEVRSAIRRCNYTLITNFASGATFLGFNFNGGVWFELERGTSTWLLKCCNSETLADVQTYFTEHPTTVILNGADESYYTLNKLDYAKRIAEETAEEVDAINTTTPRVAMTSSDTTAELEPNKFYVFPEMSALTVTLATPTDNTIVNEYHFIFTSGATATTLTIPATVKQPVGFTVDADMVYEVSIMEGNMTAQGWAVTSA